MRTFETFKALHEAYKNNQVPRVIVDDIAGALSMCDTTTSFESCRDSTYESLLATINEDTFIDVLGGDVFICESKEDLGQIEGTDVKWAEAHDGKWPTLLETPLVWDAGGYLLEKETRWAFIFLATNNGGGPVYYIPEPLWSDCLLYTSEAETV